MGNNLKFQAKMKYFKLGQNEINFTFRIFSFHISETTRKKTISTHK